MAGKVDGEVLVGILKEEDTDYTGDFLGDLESEIDHVFETVVGRARPTLDSAEEFIDDLRGLEDGSEVVVSGELNELCVAQAGQISDYVSHAYDLDLEIFQGVSIPERPVERVNGEIRFV